MRERIKNGRDFLARRNETLQDSAMAAYAIMVLGVIANSVSDGKNLDPRMVFIAPVALAFASVSSGLSIIGKKST